jgi:hypothetical protein
MVATALSPIFELVAHSSQMAIFVICNEHGGESVTAPAGFTAVLVGDRGGQTAGQTAGRCPGFTNLTEQRLSP